MTHVAAATAGKRDFCSSPWEEKEEKKKKKKELPLSLGRELSREGNGEWQENRQDIGNA